MRTADGNGVVGGMGASKEGQGAPVVLGVGFSIETPMGHLLEVYPAASKVPPSLSHHRRAAYLRTPVPGRHSLLLQCPVPAGAASTGRSSEDNGC